MSSNKTKKPVQKQGKRSSRSPYLTYTLTMMLAFAVVAMIVVVVMGIYKKNLSANSVEPTAATATYKQYSSAPEMTIDTSKRYLATVKMAKGGEFVIELYAAKAPVTVNSFIFLAREGYFNGVTFHRVIKDFMAQTGDPTGTGYGGPGYTFVNEDNDLTFDKAGVVAMANAGRDTNGSQFFITFGPAENLNGDFTIFGQVVSGMDVVNNITLRNPDDKPEYTGDVIESIEISEN
jgi:cyclophilin family peptidyl-prolyl cis-trans isomerase